MDPKDKKTPDQELKNKLKQIRADYTRAKNLLKEISDYHKTFVTLRAELDDTDDGLEANQTWIAKKKEEVGTLVTETKAKLAELETTLTSVNQNVKTISDKYTEFTTLSNSVFDPTTGLAALFEAATTWHDNIKTYDSQLQVTVNDANAKLVDINATSKLVTDSYTKFTKLLAKIDDPKTGIQEQLKKATQYADDALTAKNNAEKELASVIALKEEGGTVLEDLKLTKEEVESLKTESDTLTDDIRNTLGLVSSKSLSNSFGAKATKLNDSLRWWGIFVGVLITLLTLAVGTIFYFLFVYPASHGGPTVTQSLTDGPSLVSVISKIIFTSPLVFGLYFVTTNFSHVRDLRDKYSFKETISKSLQAYVKLLRSEFEETEGGDKAKQKEERYKFSLDIMRAIYEEPTPKPKKKRYNFAFGKVFQVAFEDEDIRQIEKRITETVEDIIDDRVSGNDASSTPTA